MAETVSIEALGRTHWVRADTASTALGLLARDGSLTGTPAEWELLERDLRDPDAEFVPVPPSHRIDPTCDYRAERIEADEL